MSRDLTHLKLDIGKKSTFQDRWICVYQLSSQVFPDPIYLHIHCHQHHNITSRVECCALSKGRDDNDTICHTPLTFVSNKIC
jgi:hypothetical protein